MEANDRWNTRAVNISFGSLSLCCMPQNISFLTHILITILIFGDAIYWNIHHSADQFIDEWRRYSSSRRPSLMLRFLRICEDRLMLLLVLVLMKIFDFADPNFKQNTTNAFSRHNYISFFLSTWAFYLERERSWISTHQLARFHFFNYDVENR